MKQLVLLILVLFISHTLLAQGKFPAVDKSPMDMVYYPVNFPLLKVQDKIKEPLVARAIFSRPQKNGRPIFGDFIEFNKVWRLGANEASEVEFFLPVKINNTRIKKGRYTLYAIPDVNKWTLILNRETDTWGSFKYDEKKDVVRVDLAVEKQKEAMDFFGMTFEKTAEGFALVIAWDDAQVSLPVTL